MKPGSQNLHDCHHIASAYMAEIQSFYNSVGKGSKRVKNRKKTDGSCLSDFIYASNIIFIACNSFQISQTSSLPSIQHLIQLYCFWPWLMMQSYQSKIKLIKHIVQVMIVNIMTLSLSILLSINSY